MNSILVNIAVGAVGLFAVPLLTTMFANLLHKLAQRAQIDINEQQEAKIKALAGEAALFTEEWAAAKFKATGNKPTQDDKMSTAVEQLQKDLPGLTNGTAINLIKTALPKLRLGALFSKVAGVLVLLMMLVTPVFAAGHPDQKAVVAKAKADLVAAGKDLSGPCGAFQIADLAAWRLKAQGDSAGILSKPAGNNCRGYATDIIAYPDGQIYDVLIDGGASNGPNWGDDGTVDPSRYHAPLDPNFDPTPVPVPVPPAVDLTPRVDHLEEIAQALVAATNKLGEQTQALMALANDTSARVSILELKPIPVACSAAVFGIPIHCALTR